MAISFRCGCGRTYKTDAANIGRSVRCKGCGGSVKIAPIDEPADVYGLEEPVISGPVLPRMDRPPLAAKSEAADSGAKPKTSSPSKKTEKIRYRDRSKGTVVGVVLAAIILIRVWARYNREHGLGVNEPPPVAPAQQAFVNQGFGGLNNAPPQAAAAPAAAWAMPVLPQLGAWREIEQGVLFQEVRLPGTLGPATPPAHSGKIWIYLPAGQKQPNSLPCVLITGAGSRLFTGMDLGNGDRAEHLPYARAGFAVVAYEMDGFPPDDKTATDQDFARAAEAFFRAQAGLLNAKVAIAFATSRLPMVDGSKLFTAGHSSAATTALLVAANEPTIKACAAFAPVVDMNAWFAGPRKQLVLSITPAARNLFSIYNPRSTENQIRCPLMLFYAADDNIVSTSDIRAMAERLKAQSKTVELVTVASGGHYDSMIQQGIPTAINWFRSLSGG